MILAYLVLLAVLIGFMRGGRLQNYIKRPLRLVPLPALAFVIEAFYDRAAPLMGLTPQQLLPYATCLQYALLFVFAFFNLRRSGGWWVMAGTVTNFLVISMNGFRMPVSAIARQIPDLSRIVSDIDTGKLAEYMIADQGARLLFLGDVIHMPFLPGGGLGSVGDFLLGIGVSLLIMDFMVDPGRFRRRARRSSLSYKLRARTRRE